jgi:hypothetical protein
MWSAAGKMLRKQKEERRSTVLLWVACGEEESNAKGY